MLIVECARLPSDTILCTVLFLSPEVEHLEPVQFVEDPGGELPHAVVLQPQLLEAGQ